MAHKNDTDRAVIAAPFGRVAITLRDGALVDVSFPGPRARLQAAQTPLGRRLCAQMRAYFANPHARFADGIDDCMDAGGRATPGAVAEARAARRIGSPTRFARSSFHLIGRVGGFDIPLELAATPHQRRVWRALQRIPTGAVVSYGTLARRLKSSARAVGGACRANPVPLVIPCHRVVSATGEGGFMGKTGGHALRIKRWLLAHERAR
jgi:methylated-DNA-[protein]-cysteine S-methyltransferase